MTDENFYVFVVPPSLNILYTYQSEVKSLSKELDTVYVKPNEEVKLECKVARGEPNPDFLWSWQNCNYQRLCEHQNNKWKSILKDEMYALVFQ